MDIFNSFYQFDHCTSDPDAEVIVLLHGLGLNARMWEPLAAVLTERYHVVRYDLYGHGGCLHDGSELTWELLCNDLEGIFHQCGIIDAHLVGHGFGGSLAARYGVSRPERVKTIVLMSTIGFYPPEAMERSVELRRSYAENGVAAGLAEQMTSLVTCLPQDREEVSWIREAYLQCDMDVYFKLIELFAAENPLDDLSAMNKPCLVMAGDKDTIYPSYMSKITSQFIPNAFSVTVPDAASMVFIDNLPYAAQKLLDFLSNPSIDRESPNVGDPLLGLMRIDAIKMFGDAYKTAPSKKVLLEVKLIGTFRVSINGKEIPNGWQQRNAKRLLVYLLFHPNPTREQLCDALWPLAEISKASNLLRVSLSHLKGLFDTAGVNPIVANRSHVKLHAAVECDMLKWIQSLEEAHLEKKATRKISLVKELLIYPVEEMLAGLYDNWADQERSRLEYMLQGLVESLADSYKKEGEFAAASQVMRRISNMYSGEIPVDIVRNTHAQGEVRDH
ncbi:alpha/beta hydrolase [Bacillus sp. FJAT-28004]|uniref:alpha/beta hydrolase n=1 Tax=Bacillus sp. FJAT-28004 TaxID=1679165 RepID=UPI0006B49E37|nr:alpha/beta hydrolase [Bacillus sp. FJAT-28004]